MDDHSQEQSKPDASSVATSNTADMTSTPQHEPSEWNLRSISVLVGTACGLFSTVGVANAFGVFEQYYHAHLLPDKSDFDIAWIGSVSTFIMFFVAAPAGILADKLGPQPLLIFGSACMILSWFMLSLCKEYYQVFLAQGILQGLGFATITVPAASITPHYFNKNRAAAQGITIAGSSLGGVIWPIMLDQLLNKDGKSFGFSVRIVGYITIPLLVLVVLTVRPPPAKVSDDEKQQGARKKPAMNFALLRSRQAILLFAGLGFCFFGFFAPLFFVSTYAVSLGLSERFSFYLVSIANAASLFGRIIPGILADRYIGFFNTLVISCITSAVVTFCWTAATSTAGVTVWILAYGFASGSILSLELACASRLVPPYMTGAAIGITLISQSIPALTGTPISGELEKRGYGALSGFAGAVLLVGGLLILGARVTLQKKLLAKI